MVNIIIVVSFIVVFMLSLRTFPHLFSPQGIGVDHWYWKSYIEKYRLDRQFPPVLPQYILEEHQWYPPIFPLLMARLPVYLMEAYSHMIAIFIDLARLLLLLWVTYLLTGGRLLPMCIAGLIYAATPILVSYNIQLNPRGLAALFLDILFALLLWYYFAGGPVWIWAAVIVISALILLTHKMTTQLFWFMCICTGFASMDWRLFMLIPVSVAAAILISKGFYVKVIRAHWDIIIFWNRNWPWLGVHPIKESPIYDAAGYETPTKMHRKGLKGFIKHLVSLLGYNPAAWLIILIKTVTGTYKISEGAFPVVSNFSMNTSLALFYWIFLLLSFTLLFALATTFIPCMKCLGMGFLYLYNAAFPASLLWGVLFFVSVKNKIIWSEFALCFIICLMCMIVFYRHVRSSKTKRIDESLDEVFNYLKKCPKGLVMCLPMQWLDVVSYKTGHPVLYGGHGYGFKRLQPIFPRLLIPMSEVIKKYDVRYLLTMEGYLPPIFLKELEGRTVKEFGSYQVYHF